MFKKYYKPYQAIEESGSENDDKLMNAIKNEQIKYVKKRNKITITIFFGIAVFLTGTLFQSIPALEKFYMIPTIIGFIICLIGILRLARILSHEM